METEPTRRLLADIGTHVELELILDGGSVEALSVDIVPDSAADFPNGRLGASAPLAKVLIGSPAGGRLIYHAGDICAVRLLSVRRSDNAEPEDLSSRRKEAERRAVDRSDRTSVMIYAASMNNKWGDLDPSNIEEPEE